MKQSIYIFGYLSIVVWGCVAQEEVRRGEAREKEVSIAELVDEALANNPEIEFYRAEIAAARGERKLTGAWANPETEFELGRKRSRPRSGGLSDEGMAWAVAVSQTFDWPNRIALRKAIAGRQIELAEIGLAQFKRELASEIRGAAFNLLAAQEKEEAARAVAERSEELMGALLQREPAGTSPLVEMRIIEASILGLKRRANEAAKEAESARLAVNQLRGKPIEAGLRVAPARLRFPKLENGELFVALARTNSFEIKSRVVELEQQGLKVELAKNERFPTFSVRPFFSQETASEHEQTAGVGISMPLPLWNRNKGNIDAARSRREQAQALLMVSQRSIEKQVRESLASYAIDQQEMEGWRPELVQELEEAADLADRHYRLGAVPVATYLEMQDKYLEGLETVLETQAGALEALQTMERLTGMPLGNPLGGRGEE